MDSIRVRYPVWIYAFKDLSLLLCQKQIQQLESGTTQMENVSSSNHI